MGGGVVNVFLLTHLGMHTTYYYMRKIEKNEIMVNMHGVATLTLGSQLSVKCKGP
jgi:hypothetical protein